MVVRIINSDALAALKTLPSESVQCIVTSPPFYQLRDYGVDGQIGLEETPGEFLEKLWAVFDEVKRVLRADGLAFVNLNDSYSGSGKGPTGANGLGDQARKQGFVNAKTEHVPAKNLYLIPQRFAIGMQDRGWIVRQQIVWAKAAPMPESVRDRMTSAWEPIWMFAKSQRYFYDADAVRTNVGVPMEGKASFRTGGAYVNGTGFDNSAPKDWQHDSRTVTNTAGANLRNFWLLGPEPSTLEHYAGFVSELPRRCIKAGTSEKGACAACGAPLVRQVERKPKYSERETTVYHPAMPRASGHADHQSKAVNPNNRHEHGLDSVTTTLGWSPSCSCETTETRPCVVLDPFLGSGTTLLVASQLGRDGVGIELSPVYARMAEERIKRDVGPMFPDEVQRDDRFVSSPSLFDALEAAG